MIFNPLYSEFAAQFAAAPLSSLVESFNRQVGNRGWASARAAHDCALMDEFRRRGVDVSEVSDGTRTSFAKYVKYDEGTNSLVID